ncbi:hypothetical protein V6N11_029978 [Hibiscus sabdariffa]|uniref:Uncharacterized protein n=1 Tax=Hibiscus sabdariffa TaxID=183260 RepID=A0ABR2PJG1_9ROSI
MEKYKSPKLVKSPKGDSSQQADMEVLTLNEDQEIKGKKKFGRFLPNEQFNSGSASSNGEGSKVKVKVKGDESKPEYPQGISSAIIPVSREDQKSTKEKSIAFNASDNHILASKEKVDDSSPSITSLEGEKTFPSDKCIQDKIFIDGGESLLCGNGVPLFDEEGPFSDQDHQLLEVRILDDQTFPDVRDGSLPPFGALSEIMPQA